MRADEVSGQKQIGYRRHRLGAVLPGADGVDQQRLFVARGPAVLERQARIDEPAHQILADQRAIAAIVEALDELSPDLLHDVLG